MIFDGFCKCFIDQTDTHKHKIWFIYIGDDPCQDKLCGESCIMPPPDISDVLLSDFGETVCNAQGICTFDLNNTDCDSDIIPEPPLPPPGKLTGTSFKNICNLWAINAILPLSL